MSAALRPVATPEPRYMTCSLVEIQVLDHLLRDGADNETIARRMKPAPLSIETIRTHFQRIYRKCGHPGRLGMALALARGELLVIDPSGRVVDFR